MEGNEKKSSSGSKSLKPSESLKPPGWPKRSKSPIFYGSPKTTPMETGTIPKAQKPPLLKIPPLPKNLPLINKNDPKPGNPTNVPIKNPSSDVYEGFGRGKSLVEPGETVKRSDSSGEEGNGKWSGLSQRWAREFDSSDRTNPNPKTNPNPNPKKEPPSETICRICMKGPIKSLIIPCECKGIYAYSHAICLSEWLELTGTEHCDICRYKYNISKRSKSLADWVHLHKSSYFSQPLTLILLLLFILFLAFVLSWSVYGMSLSN